jgi:uncharacterized protein YbjQ (UPF0145 family)
MPDFLIQFLPVVFLLILGYAVGSLAERRHLKQLGVRESRLRHILVTDIRSLPSGCVSQPCSLVDGEVVVASDYFKTFVANLKKMIGGELRTYETLMERARREALIRVKEAAERIGANQVVNVRFATSNIGSSDRRRMAAMVEMYAYGTAVYVPDRPTS